MSTKFFGKLATGVALGSAALLISAPGVAFADDKVDPKHDAKHDRKHEAVTDSGIEQSKKSAFNTAQNNESQNKVIAKADRTAVAVNVPIQINSIDLLGFGPLGGNLSCANGISDDVLESAGEIGSLGEAAEFLQQLDYACNGYVEGKKGGKHHKGKKQNASVVPVGEVAAGDGGAMVAAGTGGLAAAGIGMLGVAALGGTALLRRQTADDSVA